MLENRAIREERCSNYYYEFEKPPDNLLSPEWNKDPEVNPLILLFSNPRVTVCDLIRSDAFNQSYSVEVDMKKEYLFENLKLENGILFPYWWKGTPREFAAEFSENWGCFEGYLKHIPPHERPFVVLETILNMSVEPLSTPREPDYRLWD